MIGVEICIASDGVQPVQAAAAAALAGGASRIELCSAMHLDGLTPTAGQMKAARQAFDRPGLMVMVRPRSGDFCYSAAEVAQMDQAIATAAQAGADGVVFGLLQADGQVDQQSVRKLVGISHQAGLSVTFHRAFDAAADQHVALAALIECGVDRVLTSGTSWGSGAPATAGIEQLTTLLELAEGQIELIVGGGVHRGNVAAILQKLPLTGNRVSVHAFSGGQEDGRTTADAVARLVQAANG